MTTTVLDETAQIQLVYHISDIHIRLYHRLEEYECVFENLYQFLNEQPNREGSMIIVTGDILHHKNELSPECIVKTRRFLHRLADFCPTVIIAGNHDALLNNRQRLDSLSAILTDPVPQLFYLTSSGYYRYGNLVLGVSSLLDNLFVPASGITRRDERDRLIALYHGGVGKFSTNKGYVMEGGVPRSTFDGYDMTMLGDIHMHQYLDGEARRMAYAGSLISQNATETDPDHGVLVWEVASGASRLVRIDNPFAYCEAILDSPTLEFRGRRYHLNQDGDLTDLIRDMPAEGRLTLMLSRVKTAEDLESIQRLHEKMPRLHIMERSVAPGDCATIVAAVASSSSHRQEMMAPMEVLRGYLETLPEEWDRAAIWEATTASMRRTETEDATMSWELLRVEFDDMFGYGKGNVLDLESLPPHETIGIFGENSAGKSSLIEVILFLLYGQITRYAHGAAVPREVIHFQETASRGKIVFRVHGILYEIEKTMRLQPRSGKIRVDEKLWRVRPDGSREDLSEEHRKKTDKFVISQIGDCQQFLLTTIFLQQNETSFRGMSPRDRKDFLYRILDLDRLEKMHVEKSDELRLVKKELETLSKDLDRIPSRDALLERESQIERDMSRLEQERLLLEERRTTLQDEQRRLLIMRRPGVDLSLSEITSRLVAATKELSRCEDRDARRNSECEQARQRWMVEAARHDPALLSNLDAHHRALWEELEILYKQRLPLPQPDPKWPILDAATETSASIWNEQEEALRERQDTIDKEAALRSMTPGLDTGTESIKKLRLLRERLQKEQQEDETEAELERRLADLEATGWRVRDQEMTSRRSMLGAASDRVSRLVAELAFRETTCEACRDNRERLAGHLDVIEEHRRFEEEFARHEAIARGIREEVAQLAERLARKKQLDRIEGQIANREARDRIREIEERQRAREARRQASLATRQWEEHLAEKGRIEFMNRHIETEIVVKKEMIQRVMTAIEARRRHEEAIRDLEKGQRETETAREAIARWSQSETDAIANAELDRGREALVVEEDRTRAELRAREEEILRATLRLREIRQQRALREERGRRLDALQQETAILQQLLRVTGRDGFPMHCLEQFLPHIEDQLSQILSPFFQRDQKRLVLRIDKKKETTSIQLTMRSGAAETVYMGGMEGFLVDAALKIVFTRISRQPRCNLMVIDEGISVLDKKNMENIDQFFQFLETFFPHVLIISHLREAQEFVHRQIHVVKDPETNKSRLL